ncbi:MAG TPA: hypothetical protein VGE05_01565 [Novosphingobium sp.]
MMEPAGAGLPMPRAFLRVAGITLAQHQLGIARALECQRVICIAHHFSGELIALQHEAERAGLQFHVVAGARGLPGLITANDEVLVLTDGLLATPQDVVAQLGESHAVLVQSVDAGLAAGFERIDLNYAAGGAMAIPGRLVERLNELPADCDVSSALIRIALQSGIPTRELPAVLRETGYWLLVRDETAAHAIEGRWIRLHMGEARGISPGGLIVRLGVLGFGPALLHAGSGSMILVLAAAAILLMASVAGWLGFTASALLLCACGWVMRRGAVLLERIEHDSFDTSSGPTLRDRLLDGVFDMVLAAILIWNLAHPVFAGIADQAFAPLILLGLIRLLPRTLERRWTNWLEDRLLLCLVLAVSAMLGTLDLAIQGLSIALIAAGIFLSGPKTRLTSA